MRYIFVTPKGISDIFAPDAQTAVSVFAERGPVLGVFTEEDFAEEGEAYRYTIINTMHSEGMKRFFMYRIVPGVVENGAQTTVVGRLR